MFNGHWWRTNSPNYWNQIYRIWPTIVKINTGASNAFGRSNNVSFLYYKFLESLFKCLLFLISRTIKCLYVTTTSISKNKVTLLLLSVWRGDFPTPAHCSSVVFDALWLENFTRKDQLWCCFADVIRVWSGQWWRQYNCGSVENCLSETGSIINMHFYPQEEKQKHCTEINNNFLFKQSTPLVVIPTS